MGSAVRDLLLLWLATLLLIRGVVALHAAGMYEIILIAVPLLFMYMPLYACKLRGVSAEAYPLTLPLLREPFYGQAIRLNLVLIGLITVPWLIGYHYYQSMLFGYTNQWLWPSSFITLIGYHLFFVAIPEEMFYRGYMQSRLDELFEKRWSIFGVKLGWGWILTCLLFAFGHSLVHFQWWHFAIFFPSLLFGWLREKTGHIVAGALFHAWSNVVVATLDSLYQVGAP